MATEQEILGVVAPEVEQAPQLNEVEQQAYKEGWRPETEFEGDKQKWIPADEFMRRKPLFGKIDELKSENYHTRRELNEVKQTLKALSEHHKQVRQTEYNRALKELQDTRKSVMQEYDHDTVVQIEEQIDTLKEEKKEFEAQIKQETAAATVAPTPEYTEWIKGNGWYMEDKDMHDAADAFAYAYVQRKGSAASPNEVYSYVAERIRKAYPEKFETRTTQSPVDSGRSTGRPTKPRDSYQLSPEEESVARSFEKQGLMTREEYIAELKNLDKRKAS